MYWGIAKNFAVISSVPPFFKPGYATAPGVCNNYAATNVASVAIHIK